MGVHAFVCVCGYYTGLNYRFSFAGVVPGTYQLSASHETWSVSKVLLGNVSAFTNVHLAILKNVCMLPLLGWVLCSLS